jgi:hypothetical protein
MKRSVSVATVFALLVAAATSPMLPAQPAPTERLAPKVENFLGSEEVRAFRILGIGVDMNWDAIASTLARQGFEEVGAARPEQARTFVKGERTRQVAGIGESVYRVELRRMADRTQLVFHRRLVDGRISAQDATLHSQRPLPQSDDVRSARQLKALVCRGIPPGAQRTQLCPADTDRRIAINSNGRPVWLAGEVEVSVEATTAMTRVVIVDFGTL